MSLAVAQSFDTHKAEQFAGRVIQALNDGALTLMMSLGHRTGLFDVMKDLPPSTAGRIAEAAQLQERYVREWLGAMVTARVVTYDPKTTQYHLPAEHAASLTRAAQADNLSVFAQYIPLLGTVEDDIVGCFRRGGGVDYSRYARFHEVMAEDSGQSVLSSLETHVLTLVPDLRERLERGIRVLDAGCGRGRILNRLASLFPRSRFMGIDLSAKAIAFARSESRLLGLTNVEWSAEDLSDFERSAEVEMYDLITTFDAIHDQAQPLAVLKGIRRALKPAGVYLMQDIRGSRDPHKNIGHPLGTLLYTISCMHCMTVSLAQSGAGLGAMWGEETTIEYLRAAGFGSIDVHQFPHDLQNNWYVVRK